MIVVMVRDWCGGVRLKVVMEGRNWLVGIIESEWGRKVNGEEELNGFVGGGNGINVFK